MDNSNTWMVTEVIDVYRIAKEESIELGKTKAISNTPRIISI